MRERGENFARHKRQRQRELARRAAFRGQCAIDALMKHALTRDVSFLVEFEAHAERQQRLLVEADHG
jgi:hypothetical protein